MPRGHPMGTQAQGSRGRGDRAMGPIRSLRVGCSVYGSHIQSTAVDLVDVLRECTGFDWDDGNSGKNWEKHRVSDGEAEQVFFNQIQLHHVSCLHPSLRESVFSLFSEDDFPRHVYYGDGTPIEEGVIAETLGVYRELALGFAWRPGDVLMVDNMLTAHGRNPFTGARRILVAMGEIVSGDEVVSAARLEAEA